MAKQRAEKTVTIVGAGSLAHALAEMLPSAGHRVREIVTRSSSTRAKALARKAGAAHRTLPRAQWSGDVVWLAVSDCAIPELASSIAARATWTGKIVLHSSGALASNLLSPLRRRGASCASAHPMMSFVPGRVPEMGGVVWTVEGDPAAVRFVKRFVKAAGGRVVEIDPHRKPLYHAFGAFLSPLLVVHLDTAAELAVKAGIPRKSLPTLVKPIVSQTLANLFAGIDAQNGAAKAFSGPLIRGDVETVRAHLKSLAEFPAARKLYAALVQRAAESRLPVRNKAAIARAVKGR